MSHDPEKSLDIILQTFIDHCRQIVIQFKDMPFDQIPKDKIEIYNFSCVVIKSAIGQKAFEMLLLSKVKL